MQTGANCDGSSLPCAEDKAMIGRHKSRLPQIWFIQKDNEWRCGRIGLPYFVLSLAASLYCSNCIVTTCGNRSSQFKRSFDTMKCTGVVERRATPQSDEYDVPTLHKLVRAHAHVVIHRNPAQGCFSRRCPDFSLNNRAHISFSLFGLVIHLFIATSYL
jgi:hypothetical protein